MKNTAEKNQKTKTVNTRLSRKTCDGQVNAVAENTRNELMQATVHLLPRVIRLKDASGYLGMDRNRFNKEVRPDLVEFRIGTQGIGFDRLDLDAWFDEYKFRNGRPDQTQRGNESWDVKKHQGSSKEASSGISTKLSKADAFAKALAQATSKKPKAT
ncbi:MAG: hypothetical protein Q8N96_05180 [Methylovulum sp.]|nr:hypothetical protein [Methylovulum sp.]